MPTEDEILDILEQKESKGRNIRNFQYDPKHTAQGHWQITDTNWRAYAPKVGLTTKHAMDSPREDQREVARYLLNKTPLGVKNWTNFNPQAKAALEPSAPKQLAGVSSDYMPMSDAGPGGFYTESSDPNKPPAGTTPEYWGRKTDVQKGLEPPSLQGLQPANTQGFVGPRGVGPPPFSPPEIITNVSSSTPEPPKSVDSAPSPPSLSTTAPGIPNNPLIPDNPLVSDDPRGDTPPGTKVGPVQPPPRELTEKEAKHIRESLKGGGVSSTEGYWTPSMGEALTAASLGIAPLPTMVGLGVSKGAEAMGLPPWAQNAAGAVAGLATGGASAIGMLRNAKTPAAVLSILKSPTLGGELLRITGGEVSAYALTKLGVPSWAAQIVSQLLFHGDIGYRKLRGLRGEAPTSTKVPPPPKPPPDPMKGASVREGFTGSTGTPGAPQPPRPTGPTPQGQGGYYRPGTPPPPPPPQPTGFSGVEGLRAQPPRPQGPTPEGTGMPQPPQPPPPMGGRTGSPEAAVSKPFTPGFTPPQQGIPVNAPPAASPSTTLSPEAKIGAVGPPLKPGERVQTRTYSNWPPPPPKPVELTPVDKMANTIIEKNIDHTKLETIGMKARIAWKELLGTEGTPTTSQLRRAIAKVKFMKSSPGTEPQNLDVTLSGDDFIAKLKESN